MTEIIRLLARRDDCFKIPALEVKIGPDLVGDMTTSYILQADVVTASWQNGEVVYLPVARLLSPERSSVIRTSYAASEGVRSLPAVSFERLSDFYADPPDDEMRREILAYLRKSDLEKGAEIHVSRRIESCAVRPATGWWAGLVDAFQPIGLIDLPFSRGEALSSLRFELPDDIVTSEALLTIRTGVDEALDQLVIAAHGLQSASSQPNSAMALRQLMPIVGLLDRIIDSLETLGVQLGYAKALAPDAEGVPSAVKALKTATYPLRRFLETSQQGRGVGATWEEIREAVSDGVAAAEPYRVVRAVSEVDKFGGVPLVTKPPGRMAVVRAEMAYSTRRRTSLARLGTPAALLFMAFVMAFVAWRTWYAFPLEGHDLDDLARATSLQDSRESIVALLILFPAILYTQLDRIDAERVAAHRAHGMTLMLLSAGLLAPVLVAVLALGDPRPDLFAAASFTTAILLAGLGIWAFGALRESRLARRRAKRLASKVVAHG